MLLFVLVVFRAFPMIAGNYMRHVGDMKRASGLVPERPLGFPPPWSIIRQALVTDAPQAFSSAMVGNG
jgi:hypothetical protein